MSEAEKKNLLGVLMNGTDREAAADLIIQAARQRRTFAVSALAVHGVMEGVMHPEHLYRDTNRALAVHHVSLISPKDSADFLARSGCSSRRI